MASQAISQDNKLDSNVLTSMKENIQVFMANQSFVNMASELEVETSVG